jgi:hypothetical protein|tara:strand:+ start:201 stop:539 length:339 start_codon:yes stop_codon:yes gene_type:complete
MGLTGKDTYTDQYGMGLTNYYVGIYKGHVHIRKYGAMYHFECEFGLWPTDDARWAGYKPLTITPIAVTHNGGLPTINEIYNMLYDDVKKNWITSYEDTLVNREITEDTSNIA